MPLNRLTPHTTEHSAPLQISDADTLRFESFRSPHHSFQKSWCHWPKRRLPLVLLRFFLLRFFSPTVGAFVLRLVFVKEGAFVAFALERLDLLLPDGAWVGGSASPPKFVRNMLMIRVFSVV